MHLNSFNAFLADTAPVAGSQQNPIMAFLPMVLLVVVFYFILIRPQQKRAKELAKLIDSVKSGDRVGTASGLIGNVITVKDKIVTLRSGDSKLEVSKSSITEILEANNPATN